MNSLVPDIIRAAFEPHHNPERAATMAAYMRGLFPFLGIAAPERRALQKAAFRGLGKPSEAELTDAAREFWALPEREYQYAAVDLLAAHAARLTPDFIPVAREFITSKSWWDTVDGLASDVVGEIVLRHREAQLTMDLWADDGNLWVARAAIIHQLRFKSATDAPRLFAYCEQRAADKDFFIRKAIGWALREYSKTNAASVRSFVTAHEGQLSGLSKREALLWLNAHPGRG